MEVLSTSYLFLLISSIAVTHLKCQQNSPSIIFITPSQSVDIGDTVDLSCSVEHGKDFPIIWAKVSDNQNSSPLFISRGSALTIPDNRYSIRHDDSSPTYVLQISKIQDIDTGTYQCQVVTSATSKVTGDTVLNVKVPPIISDNSTRAVTAVTGETFQLSCYASGNPVPKISWRRENNDVLPNGGIVAKGNIITIYNSTKDDRGIYYCIADNGVGKGARRSVGVELEFPPQMSTTRSKYKQAIGYPAELHCSVEAYPTPDISWIKDGYQVNSDNNYQIITTSNSHEYTQSTLRIRRVDRRDLGQYRCRAINRLAENGVTTSLEEVADPVCPPACHKTDYLSMTGGSTSLILQSYRAICSMCLIISSICYLKIHSSNITP